MPMASGRSGGLGGVRLFVFDFDQTLSVFHVFKTLAGWQGGAGGGKGGGDGRFYVPPPHATSEEGQIRRIVELSDSTFQQLGGFACAAFGGEPRVNEVRRLLEGLRAQSTELVVCTKGLVGPVRKCLYDLDLLQYFAEVYGNVCANYGMTAFDRQTAEAGLVSAELMRFVGSADQANWHTKDKLIAKLMKRRGLRKDQCVLIEDDPEEIRRADPVCRTLFVHGAAGITGDHIEALLSMASSSVPQQPSPASPRGGGRSFCLVQ